MIGGPCAKQIVTATIITAGGERFVGTNFVLNPQKVCPRGARPTGIGYELCTSICEQIGHAEDVALLYAGDKARGGVMYLEGHTLVCSNCLDLCVEAGVDLVVIGAPPTDNR